MQERQQPPGRFENTLDRIDRLYTQQEFEEALRQRTPAESLGDTQTGHALSRLIDELAQSPEDKPVDLDLPVTPAEPGSPEFIDLGFLEATAAPALGGVTEPKVVSIDSRQPLPVSRTPRPQATGDELAAIIGDFERRLRNHFEAATLEQTTALERGYRDKLQRVRETARAALQQREAQVKQRYEAHYRRKEQALRENYRKLMALAQKVSQQKAQLQQARAQFDEKLKAANALYKQVEDMRRLLRDSTDGIAPVPPAQGA